MAAAKQVIEQIIAGKYDSVFQRLYGGEVEMQRKRYAGAVAAFEELYGQGRDIALYSTPGRTEIGGNHTDHNNGLVMAGAVNLDIIAVVAKNDDAIIRVHSKGFPKADEVELAILTPQADETGTSAAMVRGVAAGIVQRGGRVGGFDAYTTSNVLRGSGLSSSAAFEVCIGTILNNEYNEGRFSPVELGQIGQYAENEFFGKPSGLLDQTACAVGGAITIDFKDPTAPVVETVDFDLAKFGYKLVVTDTKGSHAGLTDEYAAIRGEMERVAAYFGKQVLREVPCDEFFGAVSQLREKTGDRAVLRAIHFYEECRRVGLLAAAIEADDFESFKELIIESGHSSFEYNQNAYSVKHPAQQGVALGLAISQSVLAGRGAWRLQGGGFAGTIQAFVPEDMLQQYCEALQAVFGNDACYVLNIRGVSTTQVQP